MAPIALAQKEGAWHAMHAGTEDLERVAFGDEIPKLHEPPALLSKGRLHDKDKPAFDEMPRDGIHEKREKIRLMTLPAEFVDREADEDKIEALRRPEEWTAGRSAKQGEISFFDADARDLREAFDGLAQEFAIDLEGRRIAVDGQDVDRALIAEKVKDTKE